MLGGDLTGRKRRGHVCLMLHSPRALPSASLAGSLLSFAFLLAFDFCFFKPDVIPA